MRLAILSRSLPPHPCGLGDHSVHLAHALRGLGHDVTLFAGRGASGPDIEITDDEWTGAAIVRLTQGLKTRELNNMLLQYTPEAFSEGNWAIDKAIEKLWRTISSIVPTSLIIHETYFRTWRHLPSLVRGTWQKSILKSLARASNQVFTASEPLVEEMHSWSLMRPPVKLPIGSNIDVAPADPKVLRRSYWISHKDIVLTLFGCGNNLRLMKRHLQAIESKLSESGIPHAWLLLGGVPRDLLSLGARAYSPGWLTSEGLSAHLSMTDILLTPHFMGLSSKRGTLMAGMAHGVAVVGTRGSMTDAHLRHVPGIALFDEKATLAFAEGVLALCRDGEKRKSMGAQNSDYFRTHLTWSLIASELMKSIERK